MTREEAEALCERLQAARIDHEVRVKYILSDAHWSVKADLKPFTFESDKRTKDYALDVIDLMAGEGDWHIGGELGRAYVSRY